MLVITFGKYNNFLYILKIINLHKNDCPRRFIDSRKPERLCHISSIENNYYLSMEFVIKKKNTKPEFRRLRTVKIVESVERGAKILKQKVISKYLRQMVLSNCTNER